MELAHSSEGYPMPALSPVDEAGLIFLLLPPTAPRSPASPVPFRRSRLRCVSQYERNASQHSGVHYRCVTIHCTPFRIGSPPLEKIWLFTGSPPDHLGWRRRPTLLQWSPPPTRPSSGRGAASNGGFSD